ncbi:MAG: glycosyltransferase [Gammaproteobacteria bacterium]|nr:glycosyltransferase [Gammaproteobacteria bacterium]
MTRLKNKPFISVIVPVYNHYEHLTKCIESVLNQTYQNYELILVDDASTDERVKILLDKFRHNPKCKILFNEKNKGISETQNSAVSLAKHEWIAFLDCDDHLAKDALFWMAKAINLSPSSSYFFSDRATVNEIENKTIFEYYGGASQNYFRPISFREKLFRNMLASHLKVIKKSAYEAVGGSDKSVTGVQDWDTALKLSEIVKFFYVPRVIYYYRWHHDSQTLANRFNLWRIDNIVRRRGLESIFGARNASAIKVFDHKEFARVSDDELIAIWKSSPALLILNFNVDLDDNLFSKFCVFNAYFDEVHCTSSSAYVDKIQFVSWNAEICHPDLN